MTGLTRVAGDGKGMQRVRGQKIAQCGGWYSKEQPGAGFSQVWGFAQKVYRSSMHFNFGLTLTLV